MSPLKLLLPCAAVVLFAWNSQALAQVNTEFKITNIAPEFVPSPVFQGSRSDKQAKAKSWLEVEVTFEWLSRAKVPKFTEELTFTYYILLANEKMTLDKRPTLLVGTVTHVNIPQEKDLHSVMYISPRTLERFFDGKLPPNAGASVTDIGVTISKQGQIVAQAGLKNKQGGWWPSFQQVPGFVLNKSDTPFASLGWDYYEALKPKAGGL